MLRITNGLFSDMHHGFYPFSLKRNFGKSAEDNEHDAGEVDVFILNKSSKLSENSENYYYLLAIGAPCTPNMKSVK